MSSFSYIGIGADQYHYNGQLREHKLWHGNGQLYVHEFYSDIKPTAESHEWYAQEWYAHEFYSDISKLEGEQKVWYRNGNLYSWKFYIQGVCKGTLTLRKKISILAFKGICRRKCLAVWKAKFSLIVGKDLASIIAKYIL